MCIFFFSLWALTQRWLMWLNKVKRKFCNTNTKLKPNNFLGFELLDWPLIYLLFPNNASYWGSDIIAQWRPIRWKEKVDIDLFLCHQTRIQTHVYTLMSAFGNVKTLVFHKSCSGEFKQLPGHKRWSGSTPESNRHMWIPNRSSYKHNPSQ